MNVYNSYLINLVILILILIDNICIEGIIEDIEEGKVIMGRRNRRELGGGCGGGWVGGSWGIKRESKKKE